MQRESRKGKECLLIGSLSMLICVGLSHAQFELWEYSYGASSTANALVYGADNSIYTAGFVNMGTTANDFTIIGLDNAGSETFVYSHDGPGGALANDDRANAVVYGADGNIYATGFVSVSGGYYDICVASVDANGTEQWIDELGSPSGNSDEGKAIVYGADDNIYVAGYADVPGGGAFDFVVLKYTNQGVYQWFYYDFGTDTSAASAVAYGTDNNIYAAGYTTNLDQDLIVVSVDTLGSENWVYTYDGGGVEAANSIVYGQDGNIYAAGYSAGNGTNLFVASIDSDGNEDWTYTYDGNGNGDDQANAIVYGDDGNIYVAGFCTDSLNAHDIVIISLDDLGNERWVRTYNGALNQDDEAKSIAYGQDGNIYTAGTIRAINQDDFAVTCTDTAGADVWVYVKHGGQPMIANDGANAVAYGNGFVYAAGFIRTTTFPYLHVVEIAPAPVPEIWVYPSFFMVATDSGTIKERTLKISNTGAGPLNWTIEEQIGSDWLYVSETAGTVLPDDTTELTVTFDATNSSPGDHYDTLIVSSNDPFTPEVRIPARLHVNPVGIEENTTSSFDDRCFVSSFFHNAIIISFTQPTEESYEVTLYNALGTPIFDNTITTMPSVLHLDSESISGLANGVYFLSIRRPGRVYPMFKLVKL